MHSPRPHSALLQRCMWKTTSEEVLQWFLGFQQPQICSLLLECQECPLLPCAAGAHWLKATGDTGCPAAAISLETAVRHFVAGRKRVRRCSSKASGDWLQLNGNVSAAPKLRISLKTVAAVCSSLLLPSLLQEAWLHHITTFWREGRRYPSWEAHSLHFFLQRRKGWSSVIL